LAHKRFMFDMPASAEVVFDTFHYHQWRARWDSLVSDTHVTDGAPCPYVGAISENTGGGVLRSLAMRTQFVAYDRPRIAAATMLGRSFPFSKWAAAMQHQRIDDNRSTMIYTYTFRVGPRSIGWLLEPIVQLVFNWQTRRRFGRMRRFLAAHAAEVKQWQRMQ
jgi:hypothetical protein